MTSRAVPTLDTVRSYIVAIEDFATSFHWSPEQLGPKRLRDYQVYMLRERMV